MQNVKFNDYDAYYADSQHTMQSRKGTNAHLDHESTLSYLPQITTG